MGHPAWPRFDAGHQILALRQGDETRPISVADDAAQHKCAFWSSLGYPQTL